jgi:hypothetical protein
VPVCADAEPVLNIAGTGAAVISGRPLAAMRSPLPALMNWRLTALNRRKRGRRAYEKEPMTEGSPWQPAHERGPQFTKTHALYQALLTTLCLAGRADPDLAAITAIMVAFDLGADIALASGALWASPDIVAALRKTADRLEAQRTEVPAPPVLATVREMFAAARPPQEAAAAAN